MPRPYFENAESKIAEIIRVDHAGEYGARKIYEGQLKMINTGPDSELIESMLKQEQVHLDYFSNRISELKVRPTVLMPLWHLGGYFLGLCSGFQGVKSAMSVTKAVEEVIEQHYQEQIDYLTESSSDIGLLNNITAFRDDEIEHGQIAKAHNESTAGLILEFVVKKICKTAIYLSKKI